jgi:NAD(P)-dependent dehydrogenase (short-subunit alcohol dehydrogenase family)
MTPLTEKIAGDADRMAMMVGRTLLKRVAQPMDIADPVVFLASPAARYITGVILPVDAGYTAN